MLASPPPWPSFHTINTAAGRATTKTNVDTAPPLFRTFGCTRRREVPAHNQNVCRRLRSLLRQQCFLPAPTFFASLPRLARSDQSPTHEHGGLPPYSTREDRVEEGNLLGRPHRLDHSHSPATHKTHREVPSAVIAQPLSTPPTRQTASLASPTRPHHPLQPHTKPWSR